MGKKPWRVITAWVVVAVSAAGPLAASTALAAGGTPPRVGLAASGQPIALAPQVVKVAASTGLTGVSCFSATNCVATGGGGTPAHPVGLVEQFVTGKTSKPVLLSQASSALNADACPEADLCVVAGEAQVTTTQPTIKDGLLAVFSHGTIHDVSLYNAGKGNSLVFRGVACESDTLCYAVGSVTGFENFVEGALFTVAVDPTTSSLTARPGYDPSTSELAGVACHATHHCYAVGAAPVFDTKYQAVVITIVNTILGKAEPTDLPGYGGDQAVACRSATVCTTVGQIETGDMGSSTAYVEPIDAQGDGTPRLQPAIEYLYGIATLDTHHQIAVGDEPGAIPITDLVTNGVASAHPGGVAASLEAISCPSTTYCVAVGAIETGGHSEGALVRMPYENLPGAPGLTFASAARTSIQLKITPPYNTGNAKLRNYRLLIQTCRAHHSGCIPISSRTVSVADGGKATVGGLKAATRYRFQSFATNVVGAGPGSPTVEASTKTS